MLLSLYVVAAVGALLILCCYDWGRCVYAWSTWLYWSGYPPLLYVTFLADFFADEAAVVSIIAVLSWESSLPILHSYLQLHLC